MAKRPKVGDRVRVEFEATIREDDHTSVPFSLRRDDGFDGELTWVREGEVTVLSVDTDEVILGAPPERSNTAIEERLQALERGMQILQKGLAEEISLSSRAYGAQSGRMAKLEKQMASLLSGANAARLVQ